MMDDVFYLIRKCTYAAPSPPPPPRLPSFLSSFYLLTSPHLPLPTSLLPSATTIMINPEIDEAQTLFVWAASNEGRLPPPASLSGTGRCIHTVTDLPACLLSIEVKLVHWLHNIEVPFQLSNLKKLVWDSTSIKITISTSNSLIWSEVKRIYLILHLYSFHSWANVISVIRLFCHICD